MCCHQAPASPLCHFKNIQVLKQLPKHVQLEAKPTWTGFRRRTEQKQHPVSTLLPLLQLCPYFLHSTPLSLWDNCCQVAVLNMVECRLLKERQASASVLLTIFALFPISDKNIPRASVYCLCIMHYGRKWSLPPSFYSICTSSWGDLPVAAWTFMTTELQHYRSLPEPAFQKGNAIGFGFGHTAGNVSLAGPRVTASLCLTFALFEAYKLLDWIFSYQHPLNPSSISWVFQQSHPDKHLTQIPWELSHPLSDSEVMGHTRQESQILVMAMREEALWEEEEGSSGCVHFIMVIVHTKLLVLQEKTLPINHPLGSILLPSACIFIQGSYSCSFMEWRKPHLTLGTSPSQKTQKPTQKAVGQTHWQLICIIFIVFSVWLFLILP